MDATTAILELLLIIGIALITPGPNALTSFAHSGLFGKKSNISLIAGMAIGLFIMEFTVGLAIDSLSENEILQIIAKGLSNNEAAKVLGLSKATIRTHLEHIYEKLDVTNRVEAVTEGIRQGIINI